MLGDPRAGCGRHDPGKRRDVEGRQAVATGPTCVEERAIDLDRTLFVIASKSGGTTETLSHFAYFWDKIPDGSHFVCITDPGTSLQKLAERFPDGAITEERDVHADSDLS